MSRATEGLYGVDAFRVPAIDPDIVEHVLSLNPSNRGSQVALERSLQEERDRGEIVLGVEPGSAQPASDSVNHPGHYTSHPSGVECIQITEHMNFNLGNAVKYIWRADEKGNALEDLEKAEWYVRRELERRRLL